MARRTLITHLEKNDPRELQRRDRRRKHTQREKRERRNRRTRLDHRIWGDEDVYLGEDDLFGHEYDLWLDRVIVLQDEAEARHGVEGKLRPDLALSEGP